MPRKRTDGPKWEVYSFFFGLVLAVILFLLDEDGVSVNWWISAMGFFCCAILIAWTTITHAVPHLSKFWRYTLGILSLVLVIFLGIWGTSIRYEAEGTSVVPIPMFSMGLIYNVTLGGFGNCSRLTHKSPTACGVAAERA